jgi:hypothetical protein
LFSPQENGTQSGLGDSGLAGSAEGPCRALPGGVPFALSYPKGRWTLRVTDAAAGQGGQAAIALR